RDAGRGRGPGRGRLHRSLPHLRIGARAAHRARGLVDPRDGPHLPRRGRRAPGAQRALEGPQPGTVLRRAAMALRLEGRELSDLGALTGGLASSPFAGTRYHGVFSAARQVMTGTKDRSATAALAPLFVAALVVCNLWHLLG